MKKMGFDLKLKLNGKRLYPTTSVKYLGIKTDENLTWTDHIKDTAIKLNRANAMLFKDFKILKFILLSLTVT